MMKELNNLIKLFKESNKLTDEIIEVIKDGNYELGVIECVLEGILKSCKEEMERRKND